MRILAAVLAVWALATPAAAQSAAPHVEVCSRVEADGSRTLCHAAVIEAPVDRVWALWSTSEGLSSWVAPLAAIDLRVGGVWEASYNPQARLGDDANIRNRVLAFAPERLLVIQIADAPPGFPHEELARQLTTAVEFEVIDARHTRVRVSMMGYRAGAEFDQLHAMFDAGNAFTLRKLIERVEDEQ